MFFAPASTRRPSATARPQSPIHFFPAVLRRTFLLAGGVAALLVAPPARAQSPGEQDTTFTSALVGGTFYAFAFETFNNNRYFFLAGDFGLSQREYLSDGSVDTTFGLQDFGVSTQRIIYTAVNEQVLTDGLSSPKVLVGGIFGRNLVQVATNQPGQNIKRFLPTDGTLDTSFNPGFGANDFVTSILPLADGSMIVGGQFDQFNKINHQHIVKLDNSGAIVSSSVFNGGLAFDSTVLSLAQQFAADGSGLNGQILAAGTFSQVNNQTHAKLARINADGSLDSSFNPVFGDRVRIVVSQPDGKILAGGDFETVNGTPVKHLVRLNYDGSVDTSFKALVTTMPPEIAAPVAVNTITPLGDGSGRYYIGGNFYQINGVQRHYLGRVLADGTVDDFDANATLSNAVQQVAIDPVSNQVYVTQNRDKSINGVFPATVFRLFGDPLPLPSVTVAPAVPTATGAQPGAFTITRASNDNSQTLIVYLTRGGSAKNRKDTAATGDYYLSPAPRRSAAIGGQKGFYVTIPAGINSRTITVSETGTVRVGRTVSLTVQPDQSAGAYDVGTSATATVTLE